MGMERTIVFAEATPAWTAIRENLVAAGYWPQMRMIDNMPAFPDEIPEDNWSDLRVSLGTGMVTLRRGPNRLAVIVWGNADEVLQRDQDAIAQACASAGNGTLL